MEAPGPGDEQAVHVQVQDREAPCLRDHFGAGDDLPRKERNHFVGIDASKGGVGKTQPAVGHHGQPFERVHHGLVSAAHGAGMGILRVERLQ